MPTRSTSPWSAARTRSPMRSSVSVAGTTEIPNWRALSPFVAAIKRSYDTKASSSCQRRQQGGLVVGPAVDHAVDEQRRRAAHLPRRDPALDITLDALENPGARPIAVERAEIEPEPLGVPA